MLEIIGLVVVAVIAGILVAAALKPNTFRVQRKVSINASPDTIFAFINDLHKWTSWSPFEKLDPAMERTFIGAEAGKGAFYAWSGNNRAGAGSMEITDTSPPLRVTMALNFTRPFKNNCIVDFTLEPESDSTVVTWAMTGPTPFVSKIMHVMINMDKMIGKEFEAGLTNLKALAEKA